MESVPCKDSPVLPLETYQWKFLFHLQISLFITSSIPFAVFWAARPPSCCNKKTVYLGIWSFGEATERDLWTDRLVANGTRSSLTEIPNREIFRNLFVNGKRPLFLKAYHWDELFRLNVPRNYRKMHSNGKRWRFRIVRPIWSVIILVMKKSDSSRAAVRFCYHSYDHSDHWPNWTPLSILPLLKNIANYPV